VCYIGGVARDGKTPKDTRTLAQKASLISVLTELRQMYPQAKIYGHRDFAHKDCPSFDAKLEYKNI
jgi:N-acetylmuramoyl-L-alanine amidase